MVVTRESAGDHVVATDGDDLISSLPGVPGGLDIGRHIQTGGGNDTIRVDGGLMSGRVDAGDGDDVIFINQLDGSDHHCNRPRLDTDRRLHHRFEKASITSNSSASAAAPRWMR